MTKDTCSVITSDGVSFDWARCAKSREGILCVSAEGVFGNIPARKNVQHDFQSETSVGSPTEDFDSAAAAFSKKVFSKIPENFTLAMPSSEIIFRTLRIPSADKDEIRDIVANQVEKDAPLPPEDMVFSYEKLQENGEETTVLVAYAPSAAVEESGDIIFGGTEKAQPGRIDRIDARILGVISNALNAGVIPDKGRTICLIEEGDSAVLVILDGRIPIMIRTVCGNDAGSAALKRIFKISLIQAEVEFGPEDTGNVICLEESGSILVNAEEAAASMGFSIKNISITSIPSAAFGCAQRTLSGSSFNLFPGRWKQKLKEASFRKHRGYVISSMTCLWLIIMAVLYGWPAVLDGRIDSLNKEIARIAPASNAVRDLRNRIDIIGRYSDRKYSPLEVLLEISTALPQGIVLSAYRYRGAENRVQVEGRADNSTFIYDFMNKLDTIPIFAENKLISGPTLNRQLGKNVFELSISFSGSSNSGEESE